MSSQLMSVESISAGVNIAKRSPAIFAPAVVPLAVHLLFVALAYAVFPTRYPVFSPYPIPHYYEVVVPNAWLLWGGRLLASIIGFVAGCVVVDMASDIISGRQMDPGKSLGLVVNRLGTLILAAIISAICSITIILIPAALFIITIAVIEGTDALESAKRAVDFVLKNLGESVIFAVIVIVASAILSFAFGAIPVVGAYVEPVVMWMADVVFITASVHFYLSLRQQLLPPPPPPPPPPIT